MAIDVTSNAGLTVVEHRIRRPRTYDPGQQCERWSDFAAPRARAGPRSGANRPQCRRSSPTRLCRSRELRPTRPRLDHERGSGGRDPVGGPARDGGWRPGSPCRA
jgi:hypothetical protein